MLASRLARLQVVFGLLAVVYLTAGLVQAARDGFFPDRKRYAPWSFSVPGALQVATQLYGKDFTGKRFVFLARDEAEIDPMERRFAQGARRLGAEVEFAPPDRVYEAARGADLLVVVEEEPEYVDLDFDRLAQVMRGRQIVDYTALVEDGLGDQAGFEVLSLGRPPFPPWLDPEFRRFVEYVKENVPEDEAILLVPGGPLSTETPRARWFLELNYELFPRRLYIHDPVGASGYVMEFFRWVREQNRRAPWQGQVGVRIEDRPLTNLDASNSAPTRTLSREELRAARELGVDWIIFWRPVADFRLVDYELIPLERAAGWRRRGRR